MSTTPTQYRANADYTVVDRCPLQLEAGDVVKTGPKDKQWPGWIWVSNDAGRGTYVPEDCVKKEKGQPATMSQAFNARDLSVEKGAVVTGLREVGGWLWCRDASGAEGWLPAFVLAAV